MRKADQISSLIWLIFGAFWVYAAARLPLGTIHNPGPGFFPLLLGLLLLSLVAAFYVQERRKSKREEAKEEISPGKRRRWSGAISVTAALIAYGSLLQFLGFMPSTYLLVGFLFRFLGKQSWLVVILGSLMATVVAHLLFIVLLQAQFPRGIIGL